jgi:DNA-binding beta-propeller fold protein YncE
MRRSDITRRAVGLSAFTALLAGCGGPQAHAAFFVPMPEGSISTYAMQADGRSWMRREATNQDLLYVANLYGGRVTVYTYPQGKLMGELAGFGTPVYGLCVDNAGDVFVANFSGETIVEYAHGGKLPIATLADGGTPNGCAIDPMTGDLAVTNSCDGPVGSCYPSGTVLIYKRAKGSPKAFTDPFTAQMFYCAYDRAGNLFVDGGSAFGSIGFAELPKGGASFRKIKLLLPKSAQAPGFLQWTNTHLAVASANGNAIYQYDIHGHHATRVGTTRLKGLENGSGTNQFWVVGTNVVAPVVNSIKHPNGFVDFFKFPAGGEPTKLITKSLDQAWGAVVSPAQK